MQTGNVVTPGVVTQVIRLYGDDVKKFFTKPNPQMAVSFELSTPPPTQTIPVKFKTSDSISITVFATASYKVDLDQ